MPVMSGLSGSASEVDVDDETPGRTRSWKPRSVKTFELTMTVPTRYGDRLAVTRAWVWPKGVNFFFPLMNVLDQDDFSRYLLVEAYSALIKKAQQLMKKSGLPQLRKPHVIVMYSNYDGWLFIGDYIDD